MTDEINARVIVCVRDGRGSNSKDQSTVDLVVVVNTYRDLQLFLDRALKAARALKDE